MPVPAASSSRLAFEPDVVMVLSATVIPGKTTFPVPPGLMFISEFESELIVLSFKFKLSTSRVPTAKPSRSKFPVTVKLPSTLTFSFKLIVELSPLDMEVPLKDNPSTSTVPVPFPVIETVPLVNKLVISSSVICKESISTIPVPFGCTLISPFVTAVVKSPVSGSPTTS